MCLFHKNLNDNLNMGSAQKIKNYQKYTFINFFKIYINFNFEDVTLYKRILFIKRILSLK